ncbi:MAG: hypothetical protein ABI704_30200 [Kofleriaceae bacterium]
MRRELTLSLVIFGSCSRPEPPRTTGFALKVNAPDKFGTICADTEQFSVSTNNGNPVESREFLKQTCQLSLDKDHAKIWGYTGIELQGNGTGTGQFCGLHIGPVEVHKPVPPTILENFIDDPALARQIDAKLAPIDITKEYSYQERVAGFQLDVVQQGVRFGADFGLFVDLRMNGCDQYPDASPAVMKIGRPIDLGTTLK